MYRIRLPHELTEVKRKFTLLLWLRRLFQHPPLSWVPLCEPYTQFSIGFNKMHLLQRPRFQGLFATFATGRLRGMRDRRDSFSSSVWFKFPKIVGSNIVYDAIGIFFHPAVLPILFKAYMVHARRAISFYPTVRNPSYLSGRWFCC